MGFQPPSPKNQGTGREPHILQPLVHPYSSFDSFENKLNPPKFVNILKNPNDLEHPSIEPPSLEKAKGKEYMREMKFVGVGDSRNYHRDTQWTSRRA